MPTDPNLIRALNEINTQAAFNRWSEFEVLDAEPGRVTLAVSWRDEFGQYSGFLHAGMVAALIDTACGFAAVTSVGKRVLAGHFSVNCLRPAVGDRFVARARVVKPGRTQVFTSCELFAQKDGVEKLVATGETILSVPPAV
jgi:uncharacterized protein (TIGR00369 family)